MTRKQLDEALDALAASLLEAPAGRQRRSPRRLAELALQADTVDRHRAHADRANEATAPTPRCSPGRRRSRASIRSHERDLEQLMPWARLARIARTERTRSSGAASCVDSIPTLADLPDRCDAALVILAVTGRARGATSTATRSRESTR